MIVLLPHSIFQILSFFSSRYFIFKSTQCKRVYPMEFILAKLQAYITQNTTLLYTDFTTYTFWSMFRKLAALKKYFEIEICSVLALKYSCTFIKKGAEVRPCWRSTEDSDVFKGKPPRYKPFSVKLQI